MDVVAVYLMFATHKNEVHAMASVDMIVFLCGALTLRLFTIINSLCLFFIVNC